MLHRHFTYCTNMIKHLISGPLVAVLPLIQTSNLYNKINKTVIILNIIIAVTIYVCHF